MSVDMQVTAGETKKGEEGEKAKAVFKNNLFHGN